MTINTITQEEYDTLLKIQEDNRILTFQNNGYEYIDKSKFTEDDKKAFSMVTEILKKSIVGFCEFNNFLFNKEEELRIRFQYHYDPRFTGVGYLLVNELLNGFKEKEI